MNETMESIIVKNTDGKELAVLFVEDQESPLSEIRSQMEEEIEELLPSDFNFVSDINIPFSVFQEMKVKLKDCIQCGCLVIKAKCATKTSEHPQPAKVSQEPSQDKEDDHATPPKRAKRQGTLTAYVNGSSTPPKPCATASSRKGIHVYSQRDIEESKGMEKKRRQFWNEQAEEISKDNRYENSKGDELDKLLHEKWRLYMAKKMEEQHNEVNNKIEEILAKQPELMTSITARKTKAETVARNLRRINAAKKEVEKSRDELDNLTTRSNDKRKISDKQLAHRANVRELQKAEDAFRQCLETKKKKQIIKLSYDNKLQLTAFWKQVTSGKFDPEKLPDVGYFDVIGSDRRKAWESLGEMSKTEAMENFCILLEECSPELKPWMEAQQKEAEEIERKRKEEEERKRREMEEAAERERQLLAEEEARQKAEEERKRLEEIKRQEEVSSQQDAQQQQQQLQEQQQVDGLQMKPLKQEDQQEKAQAALVNGTPHILPASLWTRPKVMEFIQHVKSDPSSVLVVGRGETMTVRVPTHDSGTCLFWEFATEHYDLGFGVSFEWSQPNSKNITVAVNESDDDEFAEEEEGKPAESEVNPNGTPRPRVDEILPVVRRPCHEEVIVGSHMYPGRGVYLLKFDNSYSLFRSKTLYYRVYYTR